MQFRILPILIVASVLMLGVRVGEIWRGLGGVAEAQGDAAGGAELVADPFSRVQVAAADADENAQGDGGGNPDADGKARAGSEPEGAGQEATAGGGAGDGRTASAAGSVEDPLSMSDEELELLQRLGERRKELDAQAAELRKRKSLIKAAEKRLEDKVAKLEALKTTIEDLLIDYDNQQDKQLQRLVKIYEKMKPDDAARIFENLEMPVLLKVVDRMNERRTAPILAEMAPEKAQALTLELAERRELPIPRE